MLYEGSLFVLVLTLAVVLLVYRSPKEAISTSQESYYREVMLGLQGRDTPEKRDQIREKIRKLETLEKDVEQNGQKYTQTAMQVAMSEAGCAPGGGYLSGLSGWQEGSIYRVRKGISAPAWKETARRIFEALQYPGGDRDGAHQCPFMGRG